MNTSDNNKQVNNDVRVVNANNVANTKNNVNTNTTSNVVSEPVIKVSIDNTQKSIVNNNSTPNNNVASNPATVNSSSQNTNTTPVVTKVVTPSNDNNSSISNNNVPSDNGNSDNKKGGTFKTVLLILFFILLFLFIMFLPEISDYFRNGNMNSDDNEVKNGNLICKMDRNTDLTDVSYQYDFGFTNKQLMSSSINTTISSEAKDVITDEYNKCQAISDISRDVDGIEVTCTTSDNITTTIQSNDYKMIDNDNLTKFTEAGGIYPEFMYKDNIYTIQNKMIRSGYDCEIKAK